MLIKTTQAGGLIVEEAENLLLEKCIEKTGNNDGQCIKDIVQEYADMYGRNLVRSKNQYAYCAMTVSVIIGRALARLGIVNQLYDAGAGNLITNAKKLGIRVDKKPAPGAIMLSRSSTGSGYHAEIVWYVRDNKIGTIGGNTTGYILEPDGCVKKAPREGIVAKERTSKSVAWYVHAEEIEGQDFSVNGNRELEHTGLITAYGGTIGSLSEDEWWVGQYCEFNWPPMDTTDEESPDDTFDENGEVKSNLGLIALIAGGIFGIYLLVK